MKRLKEINLEDGKPTVSDALIILKSSINNAKSGNVGCLYIIHATAAAERAGLSEIKLGNGLTRRQETAL